jgi:hypothetical protein
MPEQAGKATDSPIIAAGPSPEIKRVPGKSKQGDARVFEVRAMSRSGAGAHRGLS